MPWIKSNRNSECNECEGTIKEGDKIFYENFQVYCEYCGYEIEE